MREVVGAVLGREKVHPSFRIMVSVNMAYFLQEEPGCCMLSGSVNAEEGLDCPHHHPRFGFDERALPLGVAVLSETAARFSKRKLRY